jgi:hypothetical protein
VIPAVSLRVGQAGARTALHVALLGIDGAGKSTVTAQLPTVISSELSLRAGAAGDDFVALAPEADLLRRYLRPRGLPLAARCSLVLRRLARAVAHGRHLYPIVKMLQLVAQDRAARRLARRERLDVMISDGNGWLCAAGRGDNYLAPASIGVRSRGLALLVKVALPLLAWLRRRGRDPLPLPDLALFLDLDPCEAEARIAARGKKRDAHENLSDLVQARDRYLVALEAAARRGLDVVRISVAGLGRAAVIEAAAAAIAARVARRGGEAEVDRDHLAAPERGWRWSRLVSPAFVARYAIGMLHRGSLRTLTLPLTWGGRRIMAEGYSARVMRDLYRLRPRGLLDRLFVAHPLHGAVRERYALLAATIEARLGELLARDAGVVRVVTAPSGHADDLMGALAALSPALRRRVDVVAIDLDPQGDVEAALATRAAELGVRLRFVRGDLTANEVRGCIAEPHDLAIFVGLSSWLPKPALRQHLRLVARHLTAGGSLISDCFPPAPYAMAGHFAGFVASYYEPGDYALLLRRAGFSRVQASSGASRLNHVVEARPRGAAAADLLESGTERGR